MVDRDDHDTEGVNDVGGRMNIPLSDDPLLDLLDDLVNDRGKVAAAEALGVNYRTMVACYDSRRVSRRMRKALEEYRDADIGESDDPASNDADGISGNVAALEERVKALEDTHGTLAETVETQGKRLADLEVRVGGPEEESALRLSKPPLLTAED